MTISKLRKRNKISSLLVYVLHKREVRHFHVLVVQKRERNVQKIAKLLFCLLNLFFFTFSLPSVSLDLKVPNVLWNAKISPVTSCENCSIDLFSLYVLLSHFRVRDAHAVKGICLLSFLQSPSQSPRYGFRAAWAPVSECSTYPG